MFRILVSDGSGRGGPAGVRVASVPGWAVGLGAFGAALLGLTLFVIGAGLALVLAPVAIGAMLFARWRLRSIIRQAREHASQQATGPTMKPGVPPRAPDAGIIDGEYRVIEPGSR